MKLSAVHLFWLACGCEALAGDVVPFNLGSGDPTLHINYNTTNQYIVYLNTPPVVNEIDIHSGGFGIDTFQVGWPIRQIILRSANRPSEDDQQMLYPFDDQTAFACLGGSGWLSDKDAYDPKTYHYWPRKTQVFSTNEDSILISEDVYTFARTRYNLTTNQLFLGKIGTNIFYWETRDPTRVYYRTTGEKQASKYFKLPKNVLDIMGVTKALRPNKEIGIWASRKLPWRLFRLTIGSPYEDAVFEFSFKNAKQLEPHK